MTLHVCPECGAALEMADQACWLCQRGAEASAALKVEAPRLPPRYNPWAISLQSIWIVVTLLCVSFGVMSQFPGLGIIFLVLAIPALVRTLMLGNIWRSAGRPLTLGEKALSLIGSMAVVTLVAVATSTAFFVVCFPLGLSQFQYGGPGGFPILMVGAFVAGGVAAVAVAVGLINALWYQPLHRWRVAGELPTLRRRTRAFLESGGRAISILAGAAGGAFLFILPVTFGIAFSNSASQLERAAVFAMLAAGFLVGGWLGWFLSRRWPRFFAVASVFGVCELAAVWMLSLMQQSNYNLALSLRNTFGAGMAVSLAFVLIIGAPALAATCAWWAWQWSLVEGKDA